MDFSDPFLLKFLLIFIFGRNVTIRIRILLDNNIYGQLISLSCPIMIKLSVCDIGFPFNKQVLYIKSNHADNILKG